MNNRPILKIGSVDLTGYICYGGMIVTETPVYDDTETTEDMYSEAENTVLFTAVSGRKIYDTPTGDPPSDTSGTVKRLKGKSVSISAAAEGVPSETASELFTALETAKETDSIKVEYAAPNLTEADFEYPTVTSEIFCEAETETLYTLKIALNCPLIRFGEA